MLSIKSAEAPKKSKSTQKMLDFEAEMEAELDRRASLIENEGGLEHQRSLSRSSSSSSLHSLSGGANKSILAPSSTPGTSSSGRKKVKFADTEELKGAGGNTSTKVDKGEVKEDADSSYDNIYFDSDESDGGEDNDLPKRCKTNRKLLSNDELFYDPDSDAADQAWVDKQRQKYHKITPPKNKKVQQKSNDPSLLPTSENGDASQNPIASPAPIPSPKSPAAAIIPPLPSTDAVISCPACFSVLCMDCQRHEIYANQFRAMFVMNCKIDRSETLTVPLKKSFNKKSKGKKGKGLPAEEAISNVATSASDKFFPVKCKVCNSQVAVYDCEEIYHFFNCLASHP